MIIVLIVFCLFLIWALTKSHLKVHRLKKTLKLLWSDKWWRRRIYWASPMCSKCKKQSDRYMDYLNQFGYDCKKIVCKNDNHFSLIDTLADNNKTIVNEIINLSFGK